MQYQQGRQVPPTLLGKLPHSPPGLSNNQSDLLQYRQGAKFLLPCLVSCHLVHLVFNMICTSRGAKVHSMTMVICTSREAKFPVSSMTKVVFCAVSSTGRGAKFPLPCLVCSPV